MDLYTLGELGYWSISRKICVSSILLMYFVICGTTHIDTGISSGVKEVIRSCMNERTLLGACLESVERHLSHHATWNLYVY